MLKFNMEEISSILNDINLITKVKFDLYDKDFNILHGENQNMCEFCRLVRSSPECYKKCIKTEPIVMLKHFSENPELDRFMKA